MSCWPNGKVLLEFGRWHGPNGSLLGGMGLMVKCCDYYVTNPLVVGFKSRLLFTFIKKNDDTRTSPVFFSVFSSFFLFFCFFFRSEKPICAALRILEVFLALHLKNKMFV